MKRFAAIFGALVLGIVIGSARRSLDGEHDPCASFTVAGMLQDPELARQYFGALHGDASSARQQLDAMVGELRAMHGCSASSSSEGASGEPFAHPPPPGTRLLPPGHPPIEGSPAPVFGLQPGTTLTI
jgi:hypothetical protein